MNQDQILSIVRGTLKVVGGGVIAKGLADETVVEAGIGFLVAALGFWLSHRKHAA